MTRTVRASRLNKHYGEPFLEIHPSDAANFGINDANLIEVRNSFGVVILRALVTDRVPPRSVFAPIHWTGEVASQSIVSDLVPPIVDPVSG